MLLLQLLQHGAARVQLGGAVADRHAGLKDDVSISLARREPVCHGLVGDRRKVGNVAVAAARSVGPGRQQLWIGNGHRHARRRTRAGDRHKKIRARIAVQVRPHRVRRIEGAADSRGQRVQLALQGGNGLIAGLQRPSQRPSGNVGRDVFVLRRVDVLRAARIDFGAHCVGRAVNHQRHSLLGGQGHAVAIVDLGHVDGAGELRDQRAPLIEVAAVFLPTAAGRSQFYVDGGNLLRNAVDFLDLLLNSCIQAAAHTA